MGRPTDWTPLGWDTDPVPGDTDVISQEAAHLASIAKEIIGEVAALHKIAAGGADGALIGNYADKIHSSASDLAGQLGKVIGRYQKVSSALSQWVPDLEDAQRQSVQALNDAEGPYQKLKATVVLPGGSNLTAQQKQAITNYHNAMNLATDQLNAAKVLLSKAISFRDERGSYYAGLIGSAISDSLKDSWWDQFKNWVSDWSWLIKDICTALEVIATILAVIALFIPGLDILDALLMAGFILTAVATAGRLLLAVTGNGSWFDFAMDALALLTFGGSKLMSSLVEASADSATTAAKLEITAQRSGMIQKGLDFLAAKGGIFDDQSITSIAVKYIEKVNELVPDLAKEAKPTWLEYHLLGEDATTLAKISSIAQRFSGAGIADIDAAGTAVKWLRVGMDANAGISVSSSLAGLLGSAPGIDGPGGPSPWHITIPGFTDWYTNTFETPTTAGLSTGAADIIFAPEITAYKIVTGLLP
jgi:hypothetical protein